MENDKKIEVDYTRRWKLKKIASGWMDFHMFVPKVLVPGLKEYRKSLLANYRMNGGK